MLWPPFCIGCSFVLTCRDKSYTLCTLGGQALAAFSGLPGKGGGDSSPRAQRIPAACPGFGPVLAASWPPGRGQQQPPQAGPVGPAARTSGHSRCSGTGGLLRLGATAPLPRPFPVGPAQLSTFSSKHGPSLPAARPGPSAGPLLPSECCPRSCSRSQARIHRAELPLTGAPQEGLKLPHSPEASPEQSHAPHPLDRGPLQTGLCLPAQMGAHLHGLPYPVLLLPALSLSLLPFHL